MNETRILWREILLAWILRLDPGAVLNSPQGSRIELHGRGALDREIKASLNQIKAEAISTDGSQVDYSHLASSAIYQEFRTLVDHLSGFEYRSLSSREEKLAFWINLYNALVVDAVIQENVKQSVTESWLGILSFFEKAAYRVGGERFSLTDIEHGVLRANRGFPYFPGPHFSTRDSRREAVITDLDPRIHFALNCASRSCPPIGVYTSERIDQQLDLAARSFINGDTKIDPQKKELSVSRIFAWYKNDFGGNQGIIHILYKYLDSLPDLGRKEEILASYQLRFRSYDWGLNRLS